MRDRLVEILTKTFDEQYEKRRLITPQHTAEYLLANGVIVPLCKVGDTVYQTDGVKIYESTIDEVSCYTNKTIYYTSGIAFDETAIGHSVFLTREEAEARLKGEQ